MEPSGHGLKARFAHEMRQYAIVSVYLWVCLGAMQLYKTAILSAQGVSYLPFGFAAIKALILGKFMLVGQAIWSGERARGRRLIVAVLHRAVVFAILLIALDAAEELIAGWLHGRSAAQSFAEVTGGTWLQIGASSLLMFLVLIPYFAVLEIGIVLGPGGLRRLFLGPARMPAAGLQG
ncbi:MAG: hypothetical protein JSR21_10165 [Proteobacteria bacterium]|nr:hypothetical protein [Pseudomonadota bacterium]